MDRQDRFEPIQGWLTNGSAPIKPSLSQVSQNADGIGAVHKQTRYLGAIFTPFVSSRPL